MKILFIGNVEFSARLLKKLISLNAGIAGVITKEKSRFNADHCDLSMLAKKENIPFLCVDNINTDEVVSWIKKISPDVGYCFGFSQLLDNRFLSIFPEGVIGYHPAALPQNKGRHPIVWALALGLDKTASTFFCMTEKADAGDIISQEWVDIRYEDDAQILYDKLSDLAVQQIEKIHHAGVVKAVKKAVQDPAISNNWRKRSQKDGEIDFRMSSKAIYNLVRSLTHPYIGAHVIFKGREVKVWKVREEQCLLPNIESGKVLAVEEGQVLVKCYDGAVRLIEHEFVEQLLIGEYVL